MYLLNSPHLTQRFHTSFFNWCVVTLGFFCLEVFLSLKYHIHQYHISAQGWFSACKQYLRYISTPVLAQRSGAMIKQLSNVAIGKNKPFPRSDGQCPSHLWEKRFQLPRRGSHTWGTDKPMFRIDSQVGPHAQNYKSRACTCLRQPMGRKREFRSPAGRPRGQVGGLGEGSASP